jgi:hypothetical protein
MIEAPKIEQRSVTDLIPYAANSRTHSSEQIGQIAASIKEFGWTNPILISDTNTVIAGHGRLQAAKTLGIMDVPVIVLSGLSEAQQKALVIADNKIALNADWDDAVLSQQLLALANIDFDLNSIGFASAELDDILNDGYEPVYNPSYDGRSVTENDVGKASVDLGKQIEGLKADKSEKGVEVICPYCTETFNVTGY